MATLSPHIAHYPAESLMGFATRLAAHHTGGRTGAFLRDNGIKLPDFARGEADAVHRLAAWAGVSPAQLFANAPRGLDRRHYDLRGEHVSAEFLSSPNTVSNRYLSKIALTVSHIGHGHGLRALNIITESPRLSASYFRLALQAQRAASLPFTANRVRLTSSKVACGASFRMLASVV